MREKGDRNRRRYRVWGRWGRVICGSCWETMMMMSRVSRVTRGDSHCRGRWLPVSRSGVGGIAPAGEGRLGPFEHAIECREGEEIRKKREKKREQS